MASGSGAGGSATNFTQLETPGENPHNIEADKRFTFNETGNIMLSSTAVAGDTIPVEVSAVFAEVSVFFAAMTKAITESIDPATNKPYSLYNYNAIQNVIDGSGLFVHVTEEDIEHSTNSFGANFSRELIEGVLGLASGVGALSFAQGMIASMGQAGLTISGNTSSDDTKVANIIFICEYLLGMPTVSAMVIVCDTAENSQVFSVGPCFKEQSTSINMTLHKDTYLFVTPKFIKQYAADLDSVASDLQYLEFVDYLQALVQGSPIITAVEDLTGSQAPAQLIVNKTYAMTGAFLDNGRKLTTGPNGGGPTVRIAWVGPNDTMGPELQNAEVQSNVVSFSCAAATSAAAAIGVFFTDETGANPKLAVASEGTYTAVLPS